jgi:hypothetical protein
MKTKRKIRAPKDGTPFVLRGEDGSLMPVRYNAKADMYEDEKGALHFCGWKNVLPAGYENIHMPNH